jgi:catechol 2,3-dioxygenase-like lactoylglutathione lyase family enzyme
MLFMVELAAPDPHDAGAWYVATLGFAIELRDAATGFVLLTHPAGGTKLALKRGPVAAAGVTLHLQVPDLGAEITRLQALGVPFDGDVKSSAEGYRRAKVRSPAGVTVVLFEWGN